MSEQLQISILERVKGAFSIGLLSAVSLVVGWFVGVLFSVPLLFMLLFIQ